MTRPERTAHDVVLSIPEIRDYERINAELLQRLDEGHAHVVLHGAEGQRLLAAGLKGAWAAVVEVVGRAGPELAADLDAPDLVVVCRGGAGDGTARRLRAGRVVILGDAGTALGYFQEGGSVIAAGAAGARAGLNQRGGDLAVLGAVGRLAGERQQGGRLFVRDDRLGPFAGRGRQGGRLIRLPVGEPEAQLSTLDRDDRAALEAMLAECRRWSSAAPTAQS
jgi:glutamate synthase domain-containing protein 3